MTLKEALVRFRALAKDPKYDKDQAIYYINLGWQETALRTGVLRGCVHCPITSLTYEYELDSTLCKDMIRPTKVSVADVGELDICGQDELLQNDTDAKKDTGTPLRCALLNKEGRRVIILNPTPTENKPADTTDGYDTLTDGLWVWFIKNNPYVYNENSSPELPDEWAEIGLFYAVYMANNDNNKLLLYEKLLNDRRRNLISNEIVIRKSVY